MKILCRRSRHNLKISNSGIQKSFMSPCKTEPWTLIFGTGATSQPAVWFVGAMKDAWLGIRISNDGPLRTLCMNNGNMVCSLAYLMSKHSVFWIWDEKHYCSLCIELGPRIVFVFSYSNLKTTFVCGIFMTLFVAGATKSDSLPIPCLVSTLTERFYRNSPCMMSKLDLCVTVHHHCR
jgi:hypothetical protein